MRSLVVAAGGGGDVITAAALPGLAALHLPAGEPVPVLTYSWDRLLVDPVPGPRRATDFTGLRQLAPGLHEVLPRTGSVAPTWSSLPRLAAELPTRVLLLDPTHGADGIAQQVRAAAEEFTCDRVLLLDVGGDILTDGHDPNLRSPLADQLALAACIGAGLPTQVLVAAPGLDGEIDSATLAHRLRDFGAHRLGTLDPHTARTVQTVTAWHPSEASGMFLAATLGARGLVEVRDAGDHVHLTNTTPLVHRLDAHQLADVTPAAKLADTTSLADAERIIRDITGLSEIAYETRKARKLQGRPAHTPTVHDLPAIDRLAAESRGRSADYLSVRRLAEQLHVRTLDGYTALTRLLAAHRADRCTPPLYRTT
jgi:hypothetical protein